MSELGGFGIRKGGSGGGGTGLYVRLDGTTPLTNDWNAGSYTITSDSFVSTSDSTINSVNVGKGGGNISSNTSLGNNALISNTTGVNNTALGSTALQTNIIGNENTAIGSNSLLFNVADGNTAIGAYSQRTNSTGYYNTSVGRYTLRGNTTGQENTAIGYNALQSNTIGADNVGLGISALNSNTTGSSNTALGSYTLPTNNGSNNVGIGMSSLYYNSSGSNNVGVGINSLINQTTASTNTAVGSYSLEHTIAGGNNVALGYGAGRHLADGSTANTAPTNSLFLGANTRSLGTTNDNQIVIGYLAIGNGSNTVTIGNSSITNTYLRGSLSINGAYTLPTTAPTSGQVLGYVSSGVSGWVTPTSASGIWGIANASGVYTYYATWALAVASATSGQTIELFADVIETTNSYILKDGVSINGNGHTITFTNTGHSVTDNAVAVSCSIYDLTIVRTDSTYYGLYIDNNSSKINGNNSLNIKNANTTSKGVWLDGECFGINVECASGVRGEQATSNLYNFSIKSFGAGYGVYFTANGYVSNGVIESTSTGDDSLGGALYGSNLKIKSNGFRSVNLTGGNLANSYIKNLTSLGAVCSGLKISNCYIESNGNYAVDGGEYENCTLISTTNLAVRCNNTYLYNCKVTTLLNACCGSPNNSLYAYSTTFQCKWNNASGHGTNSLVASTIVDCNFIITNASAYAIYSDSVASVVMYGNKIKGTTNFKNANITQSQTNTADAQGNVILN